MTEEQIMKKAMSLIGKKSAKAFKEKNELDYSEIMRQKAMKRWKKAKVS